MPREYIAPTLENTDTSGKQRHKHAITVSSTCVHEAASRCDNPAARNWSRVRRSSIPVSKLQPTFAAQILRCGLLENVKICTSHARPQAFRLKIAPCDLLLDKSLLFWYIFHGSTESVNKHCCIRASSLSIVVNPFVTGPALVRQ